MAAHTHIHTHPHLMGPLRLYAVGHPYAAEWLTLAVITLAALLLWVLNS